MDAKTLSSLLQAVCPMAGLALPDSRDKSTWRLEFDPKATAQQIAAAQAIIAAVDVSPLGNARIAQTKLLTAACAAAIVGGFTSSALGAPYTYPNTDTDQRNLLGQVLSTLLPSPPASYIFWCADGAGVWAMRNHTLAQIQQVGADGKAWVVNNQTKLVTLGAQVAAAADIPTVQAITWS